MGTPNLVHKFLPNLSELCMVAKQPVVGQVLLVGPVYPGVQIGAWNFSWGSVAPRKGATIMK